MKPIPTKTSLISFETILKEADIKEGHITADLGCGSSLFFLHNLSSILGQNATIYVIDILESVLKTLKREIEYHDIPGITLLRGDLDTHQGITLPDDHIDRAFLINTLHQSANTIGMLAEIKRFLNKNGLLLLIDWENKPSPLGPHQNHRLSSQSAKEIVESAGFKIKNHFEAGPYHYGLVLMKK